MDTDGEERTDSAFRFAYDPGVIRYGRGCVAELDAELAEQGFERALVVCGSTVGNTPAVIGPVERGLGDRLGGVFDRTTPDKLLRTASDGADAMREVDADVLVSLGGGSSLDTAKVVSVLAASDRPREDVGREFADRGTITVPDGSFPVVAIPTTLAGADLSQGAGVNASPDGGLVDEPVSGGVSNPRLMPAALFYDPDLFATTPKGILTRSAMNGFDKGIETLYARDATPITDATATRGLGLLRDGLPALGADSDDERAMERAVEGTLLVQYGISRPDRGTLSIIHAFGHGLTAHCDLQQGTAHAIVAPHALRYLFENAHARRDLLADALGTSGAERSDEETAEDVVAVVADVRDALGLPSRLRSVDGLERAAFRDVAETTLADSFMQNAPAGLDPTVDELEGVLRDAW